MNDKNCSNCRHSSSSSVPENVEVVFDENIIISDETVPFYTCRAIDEKPVEIGVNPVSCHLHSESIEDSNKDAVVSDADKMIAKFEARMKKRESEERDG